MAVIIPMQQLASMLSVVVAGWLASTLLRNFAGSVGGLHVGPIDTIFTVTGVLIVIGGGYGLFALPGKPAAAAAATAEVSEGAWLVRHDLPRPVWPWLAGEVRAVADRGAVP
jgi:hypothetical protein